MIVLYGIATCSTVKKARNWLTSNQLDYQYHDIRLAGLSVELLGNFAARVDDWQCLLNKKSASWRKLSAEQQNLALTLRKALPLIVEHPTLLKRPILDSGTHLFVGFDVAIYERNLL
ncbi:MAG: Spx/MgsR family RNA polymerase-binding regulatory protein [Methylococcales bacterium]|jgi:Spx/MgsR family transcriptional regulator|nr:Spx/MgsR family RNA polymerase-binding regulatory protein [Methylococcales bacterium]